MRLAAVPNATRVSRIRSYESAARSATRAWIRSVGPAPARPRRARASSVCRWKKYRMFSRGSSRAACLRRRCVHGQTKVDVPGPGVPGLRARRPDTTRGGAQLRDVQVAHPDEQRQSGPPDPGKGLRRVRRHPERRVRQLVRPRSHHGVRDPVEPALIGEGLALPRFAEDRQRLLEARLALPVRDAERVVGRRGAATADAEVEAALAEMVDGRDLLGDAQGMDQRQHRHGHADAHARRPGGQEARQRHRRRLHGPDGGEVDLAQPHAVEPPGLRRFRQLDGVLKGRRLARARDAAPRRRSRSA